MPRSSAFLCLLSLGLAFGLSWMLSSAPRAADDGLSSLPRREDVFYHLPGAGTILPATLSWLPKLDNDSAFAGLDSVTPSVWISGPVYTGISWFWKEDALPGDIFFVGWAANLDTVVYDPPMRWLPLSPSTVGSWETTATSNKGEEWTFRFQYSGTEQIEVGTPGFTDTISCWRIVLEQVGPSTGTADEEGVRRDGMGVPHLEQVAKAFTDTLWYEVDAMPRRRMRSGNAFPQDALIYIDHLTRETPVPTEGTGVGGFKARFRR